MELLQGDEDRDPKRLKMKHPDLENSYEFLVAKRTI